MPKGLATGTTAGIICGCIGGTLIEVIQTIVSCMKEFY